MKTAIMFGLSSAVALGVADPLLASPVAIDLPAGRLKDALDRLSSQAHISVAVAGDMPTLRTRRVSGRMEPGEALDRLLKGTGWEAQRGGPGLWKLVRILSVPRPPAPARDIRPDEAIVVTALKRGQMLANMPASVTVVDGSLFGSTSTARTSSDIAEQAGSVFSTNQGPGRERIFLRGVADSPFNGPTQSTVGLYLDDSKINYALPDPDLRLVDIDRIEIVRGPQGTLYGTGALGGIVRVVTNRPEYGRWGGGIAMETTAIAHGSPGGAVEAYLNAPLDADSTALRAVAYADETGGWIDNSLSGTRNINRSSRLGGRADLRISLAPDWTLDISTTGQLLRARDTQYATSGLSRATALAEPYSSRLFLSRIEAKGKIGGLDFLSSTGIESNETNSRFDASSVAAARGMTTPLAYDEKRQVFLIAQEFRLSDPRDAHRWVFGASIVDAINVITGIFTPAQGAAVTAQKQGNLSLEAAVFGEATQALTSRLDLTVGLRAFTSNIYDDPRTAPHGGIERVGLTPSTTLSWRASDATLLWLRYSGAIRPGGRNLNGNGDSLTFRADKLSSVELGGRLKLLDGHLHLNATLFALDWRNVQSDLIGEDGLITTVNAGDADNYGIELDGRATWGDFAFDAALTRQNGHLYRAFALTGDGLRLPILPNLSGRARLSWEHLYDGLTVGAYVSANMWEASSLGFSADLLHEQDSRTLLDAGLSIGREKWRIALNLSNLLDSRADSFAFGNPFSYRTSPQQTPMQPRTFGIRIEYRF